MEAGMRSVGLVIGLALTAWCVIGSDVRAQTQDPPSGATEYQRTADGAGNVAF